MAKFKQSSFSGGMNLLLADTKLPVTFTYKEGDIPYAITYNQYRLGINCRTRFDDVRPIFSSVVDLTAPKGNKQAIITFGNYLILFNKGSAYYKLATAPMNAGWTLITDFDMSDTAPRYWTCQIPVSTTLYGRLADTTGGSAGNFSIANLPIQQIQLTAAESSFGNNPGIIVQDGVNQPQFIFIDTSGTIQCRTTQDYDEWSFPLNPENFQLTGPDDREYVPVGTYMAYWQGKLMIVDPNFTYIYQSVSGRPLDFVINVDENGQKSGDATTTSTSVGVAGITAMAAMTNGLFVAAGGAATFMITLNQTPNAPTIFGEYTFNRQSLFNASCPTEQGIVSLASGENDQTTSNDTVFIAADGLRSFNAVESLLNSGRNSVFSSLVQNLFTGITQVAPQSQTPTGWCSAVSFNNYLIFSVNTVYGYVLVVYDTINGAYQSLDVNQLGNHAAKQFAAINVTNLSLWCITDDDRVLNLYAAETTDPPAVRIAAMSNKEADKELKVMRVRTVFENITENITVNVAIFTNNVYDCTLTGTLKYLPSSANMPTFEFPVGNDLGTQSNNVMLASPKTGQGWKTTIIVWWTGDANLITVDVETSDIPTNQPSKTQQIIS